MMTDTELIPPEDLEISLYPPHPQGGQHAGLSYGVKVEHLPTGTIAIVQMRQSSQHRNRTIAQRMIEAALTDPEFRS